MTERFTIERDGIDITTAGELITDSETAANDNSPGHPKFFETLEQITPFARKAAKDFHNGVLENVTVCRVWVVEGEEIKTLQHWNLSTELGSEWDLIDKEQEEIKNCGLEVISNQEFTDIVDANSAPLTQHLGNSFQVWVIGTPMVGKQSRSADIPLSPDPESNDLRWKDFFDARTAGYERAAQLQSEFDNPSLVSSPTTLTPPYEVLVGRYPANQLHESDPLESWTYTISSEGEATEAVKYTVKNPADPNNLGKNGPGTNSQTPHATDNEQTTNQQRTI